MSSADLVTVSFAKESIRGVAPVTPTFKRLRYNSESLSYSISNTTSNEIRPNRTQADLIQTDATVGGDISSELSYSTFDDLIAAALCTTWPGAGAGTIKNGVDIATYTIQKEYPDISQFHNFNGCAIDGWNLSFELGAIISSSLTVIGMGHTADETQYVGATFTDAPVTQPMNAVTNFQDITIDSVPYSGCISSMSMALINGYRANKCLGQLSAKDIKLGTLEITGALALYFNDGSMYKKFVDGAEFSFSVSIKDNEDNAYKIEFPRVKYESAEAPASGNNTDVMLTGNWRALADNSGTMISITRTPKV